MAVFFLTQGGELILPANNCVISGHQGEIDAPESVQGMLGVMASLTEKQSGAFLDYKGKNIPW